MKQYCELPHNEDILRVYKERITSIGFIQTDVLYTKKQQKAIAKAREILVNADVLKSIFIAGPFIAS
jgi:hypothetical protein